MADSSPITIPDSGSATPYPSSLAVSEFPGIVDSVSVTVDGSFGDIGGPAQDVRYEVTVQSPESEERVRNLLYHTDTVAEVQNTLRRSTPINLAVVNIEAG